MINHENNTGLSRENRNFLVGLAFALLLIFGPIEPYGMIVRLVYLVVIPVLIYFLLMYFGKNLAMGKKTNDYLNRTIIAGIAGALLVGSYLSITTNYYTECDQYVRTRDGQECVGDYVTVKGPDKSGALMQVIFAGFAIWYATKKRKGDNE